MKRVQLTRPLRSQGKNPYVAYVEPTSIIDKKEQSHRNKTAPPPPLKGEGKGGLYLVDGKNEKENKPELRKESDLRKPAANVKSSLDQILDAANGLPAAERKVLLAHLAFSEQTSGQGSGRDLEMWAQAVYEALGDAVGVEVGAGQGPALIKRTLAVPAAWAPVTTFMASSKLSTLMVVERQAIYVMLAKMVVQNARYIARKSGAPLAARLVGSCAANVASLFDNAFPGYVASGLALMVAKQLCAPKSL